MIQRYWLFNAPDGVVDASDMSQILLNAGSSFPLEETEDTTKNYTKEDITPLPSSTTDLAEAVSVSAVALEDNQYDDISSSGKYAVMQFKDQKFGNSYEATWIGKSNIAPSTSPVYLQIWNYTKSEWETLTMNDTADANTKFTLTKTLTPSGII